MTIEKALHKAGKIRKKLSNKKDELSQQAAYALEALERIIIWYDGNQRRMIKAIAQLGKRNRLAKHIISYYVIDSVRCWSKSATKEDKETVKKIVEEMLGGDNNDPS